MNWLSHKSNASMASLRGRSGSFNRDQSTTQPMRISEPYPLRDDTGYYQNRARTPVKQPGYTVEGSPTQQQQQPALTTSVSANASPARRQKRDLPPIPQSPNTTSSIRLRSTRSSPSLSPSAQTFKIASPALQPLTEPENSTHTMLSTTVPPLTPSATPLAQSALPLPSASSPGPAPVSRDNSLSIITTTSSTAPQPAFEPVLVSPDATFFIPTLMNPNQFIVALETSTATHRTTLSTLTSRPSFLADYLHDLKEKEKDDDNDTASTSTSSVPPSPFTRAFNEHLTSSGLNESQQSRVHLFLDRPSSPYAHILTYLRSPTTGTPSLPRAVQIRSRLGASSAGDAAKLDALYELRDEAVYLGLRELSELCETELKRVYSLKIATRPDSDGSSAVQPASPVSLVSRSEAPPPPPRNLSQSNHGRKMSRAPSQVAVPESVHETDTEVDLMAETAPWQEVGIRTSFDEETASEGSGAAADVSTCTVTPLSLAAIAVSASQPQPQPLIQRRSNTVRASAPSGVHPVVVGSGLANRSRSHSRTGARTVVPPTMTAVVTGRTSFLPSMTSPVTPGASLHSTSIWL